MEYLIGFKGFLFYKILDLRFIHTLGEQLELVACQLLGVVWSSSA